MKMAQPSGWILITAKYVLTIKLINCIIMVSYKLGEKK